ncbi:Flp pilus assembly protein CpaB [Fusibacter ferrireducens]|uniref:Pilus assembly protein CpaB n=1 Tax=Fusibacter ferrireducens TaxID=2785058 RepID=A0ABR9ZP88_9FIRM|nr:RcpC/CpaB family pilus assembly protein [Fusibacter ferrireducens]MBF4692285.1 pilus assembly protein CpaB [Fusibacter ferrireducens]
MKKILRNRTVLGIASIVLSLIICFGLTPLFNRAISEKVSVVRVTENIQKGELITKKVVETVEIGGYNLPDSVLRQDENIIGKYALTELHAGDYILNSKISNKPLENYEYLSEFDGSERAISVSIKSFAAGLSGKLEQGDIVTLMASDFGDMRETVSPVDLQYVEVLAVTAGTGLDTDEYEIDQEAIEKDKELPSTITLKVTNEQAMRLAEMEAKGKIHVIFVYRGTKENADKFLDEQRLILSESEEAQTEIIGADAIHQDRTMESDQDVDGKLGVSDEE